MWKSHGSHYGYTLKQFRTPALARFVAGCPFNRKIKNRTDLRTRNYRRFVTSSRQKTASSIHVRQTRVRLKGLVYERSLQNDLARLRFRRYVQFSRKPKKSTSRVAKFWREKKKAFFVRNDDKNLDGVLYVEMFLNNTFLDPENLSIPDLT